MFSFVSMTAFGLSIYLIVRARKDLKWLFTMLEESNETIFQMKEAMYVSFKELQLNMDKVLKSHVIYNKPSLKTIHNETNKTIVEVDIHCCQMEAAKTAKLPNTIGPKGRYYTIITIEEIASYPE